jgi:RsiW-degrading membrane proteinase PrsW (M82 family)
LLLGLLIGIVGVSPFVLVYLLVIKAADRYEPEPWWLLGLVFLWGAFGATFLGMVGGVVGQGMLSLAMGEQNPLLEGASASIVAPIVEETTKGLGLLVVLALSIHWFREWDGPMDGAIFGGMVGLGFTLTEDILYVASATARDGAAGGLLLVFFRTALAGLGHASFTAMTGLGLGVALVARNAAVRFVAPVAGWCLAVALHAFHNALVSFFGVGGLVVKLLVFWLFDVLFFALLIGLALRDRETVRRGLADEVGGLLDAAEYEGTTSYKMLLPLWNLGVLSRGGLGRYRERRRKQLALVELAFLKDRRRRGETGSELDRHEDRLRQHVAAATASGVWFAA